MSHFKEKKRGKERRKKIKENCGIILELVVEFIYYMGHETRPPDSPNLFPDQQIAGVASRDILLSPDINPTFVLITEMATATAMGMTIELLPGCCLA